jgi:hypothetical protein
MGIFNKLYLLFREIAATKRTPNVCVETKSSESFNTRPFASNYLHARSLLIELQEVVKNDQQGFTEPEVLRLMELTRITLVLLGRDNEQIKLI